MAIRWPWLSGRVTIPWDAKAHFQPQIQFLARSLAEGQSPFWAPFVFSGHPQIADPQAMIFSPPFLALSLLSANPSLWAADATVLAMVFLGGAALMAVVSRPGLALGGRTDRGARLRLRRLDGLAHPAYRRGAEPRLSPDRARLPRPGAWRARSIVYGAAAGLVAALIALGRDQVALLALYLLIAFGLWRILSAADIRRAIRAGVLPLMAAAVVAAAIVAIPVTLTALLAEESNRTVIDYAGAGRGSLHPALLLTAVMPDLFGAAGRMEDYWGPPSFAWAGTDLFIAQNMGVLYIGAVPLLLLALAAMRGALWEREIRFFAVAALVTLVYALGRSTPLLYVSFHLLPGVSLFRRPADATFLLGALAAILAGYGAHRLLRDARAIIEPRQIAAIAAGLALAFAIAVGLAAWLDRLDRLPLPVAVAVLAFAAALLALVLARPTHRAPAGAGRRHSCRRHGRRSRLQQRPELLHRPAARGLRCAVAGHRQRHHRHPQIQGRRQRHAPGPDRAGGPRLPLAQRQPHARPREHAGLQSRAARALQRGDRRGGSRRPAGPAQVHGPLSLLPLHARQSAGPALHRHRRSDREHGPHVEARRPAARRPHHRRLRL